MDQNENKEFSGSRNEMPLRFRLENDESDMMVFDGIDSQLDERRLENNIESNFLLDDADINSQLGSEKDFNEDLYLGDKLNQEFEQILGNQNKEINNSLSSQQSQDVFYSEIELNVTKLSDSDIENTPSFERSDKDVDTLDSNLLSTPNSNKSISNINSLIVQDYFEPTDNFNSQLTPCLKVSFGHPLIESYKSHPMRSNEFDIVREAPYLYIPLVELIDPPSGTEVIRYEFNSKSSSSKLSKRNLLKKLPSVKVLFSPIFGQKVKKETQPETEPEFVSEKPKPVKNFEELSKISERKKPIIGKGCKIHSQAFISDNVEIGDYCILEENVRIVASPLSGGIKIGNNNILRGNVKIINDMPEIQLEIGNDNNFNRDAYINIPLVHLSNINYSTDIISPITFKIGNRNNFGTRSYVHASIGSNCKLLPYSRIIHEIPDDIVVHSNGIMQPCRFQTLPVNIEA